MKYKRLTTKDEEGNWTIWEDDYSHPFEALQVAIERLAELEDDLESGKIVRLPCNVCDKLYKVMPVCGVRRIVEFEVHRISIYGDEICIFFTKSKGGYGNEWCTKPQHIGKTVFLTREEAEARLKELQGERE